jgi:hypothetical protein
MEPVSLEKGIDAFLEPCCEAVDSFVNIDGPMLVW